MSRYVWNEAGLTARLGATSECGEYRERNEDFFWLDGEMPLALVLDGMGGGHRGIMACLRGVVAIQDRMATGVGNGELPAALLEAAFRGAHEGVLSLNRHEAFRNCGATVVGAYLHSGGISIAWLGDSLAFRVSRGHVERLTWPQDTRGWFVHSGRMTEEEARTHHIKNVLFRYLGGWQDDEPFEVPSFTPSPGDRLILTTDGIDGILPTEEFLAACRAHPEPQACADRLVELALERGSRDNCTAVVTAFEWDGDGPPPAPPQPAPPESPAPRRPWWRFW